MNKSILLVVALCIAATFAEFDQHVVLHRREGTPFNSGWNILRKAESSHRVRFTISLQQQNLDILESKFWENSNPSSPLFAQHMTRAQVQQLVAATPKAQKSVLRWIHAVAETLPKGNVFEVDNQLDAIVVTSTALFAERLFRTEMYLFRNDRSNQIVAKQFGAFSIPVELKEHITYVSGITELKPTRETPDTPVGVTSNNQKRQTADNQCNVAYSIKNLYNVPTNLEVTQKGCNASVFADVIAQSDASFSLASVEDYQQANGLPKNPITCIIGNGASGFELNDTAANEANLDTAMVTGMAANADTCFYLMDEDNGWMYEFTRYVFNTPEAPLVISISYSWNENDQCDNVTAGMDGLGNCTYYHIPNSQQYVNLTNVNFQKLGLLGHSIFVSAGDDGVAGGHQSMDDCATQAPLFPSASPYVTSVGATSVDESAEPKFQDRSGLPPICTDSFYQCVCSTSNNEQPATQNNSAGFDSGGGFSMYSPQPAYQAQAVQNYLKSGVELPSSTLFNGNNRGYPDIAAVGANICLVAPNSPCSLIGGTSASAPIIAGLVTLLNNDRLAAGKTPLGFFNPLIYQMFDSDSDKYFNNKFSYGNNAGECPSDMGFNFKSGYWTPITGVGSPNFATIRSYIATLKN